MPLGRSSCDIQVDKYLIAGIYTCQNRLMSITEFKLCTSRAALPPFCCCNFKSFCSRYTRYILPSSNHHMLSIRTSLRASSSKLPHTKFLSRSASFQARQFVPNPNGPNVQIVRWLMKGVSHSLIVYRLRWNYANCSRLALESDGILSLENGSFRARKFQQAFQAIDACPDAIKSGRDALAVSLDDDRLLNLISLSSLDSWCW